MALDTDLVWIRTTRRARARLNAYRALRGLTAGGTLDQTETITALLDSAGAPDVAEQPTSAAVRND